MCMKKEQDFSKTEKISTLEQRLSSLCSNCLSITALVPGSFIFMVLFQAEPQFSRISIITFFANRLQINFIELCFDSHFLVTGRTGKVIDTPSFIESCEHIPLNDLITNVTQVAKKLVIVGFTIGQTFSF